MARTKINGAERNYPSNLVPAMARNMISLINLNCLQTVMHLLTSQMSNPVGMALRNTKGMMLEFQESVREQKLELSLTLGQFDRSGFEQPAQGL